MKKSHHSFRVLPTSGPVDQSVMDAVNLAIGYGLIDLGISEHLFVSFVDAPCLQFGEDFAFAAYNRGEFHVIVAAQYDESIEESYQHWLTELAVSAIHEVVHFKQDIEGRLYVEDEDADEREADFIARQVVEKMIESGVWKDPEVQDGTDDIE